VPLCTEHLIVWAVFLFFASRTQLGSFLSTSNVGQAPIVRCLTNSSVLMERFGTYCVRESNNNLGAASLTGNNNGGYASISEQTLPVRERMIEVFNVLGFHAAISFLRPGLTLPTGSIGCVRISKTAPKDYSFDLSAHSSGI